MIAGLFDVMDPSALPGAAHLAQLVLAGTVAAQVCLLRPASARADLLLDAEMVHGDLSDHVAAGRLPGSDPQVQHLDQLLGSLPRLNRRTAVQALLHSTRGHQAAAGAEQTEQQWWPVGARTAAGADGLSPAQQALLSTCLHRLDTATLGYLHVVQPWRWLRFTQPPRHATSSSTSSGTGHPAGQPAAATTVSTANAAATATAGAAPAAPAAPSTAAPNAPQRHVRMHPRTLVRAALRPDEPASVPLSAGDIAAAISRSQGVTAQPATLPQTVLPEQPATSEDRHVDLATGGLSDQRPQH